MGAHSGLVRTFTNDREAHSRPKAMEGTTGEGYITLVLDKINRSCCKCPGCAGPVVSVGHSATIKELLSFWRATFHGRLGACQIF